MARLHHHLIRVARRLAACADRFAAAGAIYDPNPLLQVTAASAPVPASEEASQRRAARRPRLQLRSVDGAALLVVAVVLALLWANSPWSGTYATFWHAPIALTLGPLTIGADLRTWVDEGLMTMFFLVVGLEAKRERDLGELRDGRRLALPVLAGLGGMALAAVAYLAVAGGGAGAGGWGAAISTDTALALGALTLAAGRHGGRLRVFLLTLLVVDDVVALLVVSVVYPAHLNVAALAAAVALVGLLLTLRAVGTRQLRTNGDSDSVLWLLTILVAIGLWLALFASGIDPVISGLLIGLLTNAYAPEDRRLARSSALTQAFGEAPSPAASATARASLAAAISPNERLLYRLQPWSSKVVVPLFALANAGVIVNRDVLAQALTSPVTWGIVIAYVVGKPLGILAVVWVASRGADRRSALPLGWDELRGVALTAGVGFTVSLLIASRAFHGALLDQAKVGILATALISPALSVVALASVRRVVRRPCRTRPLTLAVAAR
ncbi:MAG TPA: Na+/H+ antiporter NhaA [Baekduia sp.]|jgi:Na+/H+ antiporter NhaA